MSKSSKRSMKDIQEQDTQESKVQDIQEQDTQESKVQDIQERIEGTNRVNCVVTYLKKRPTSICETLATLENGCLVQKISDDGLWAAVKYNGLFGYIPKGCLK